MVSGGGVEEQLDVEVQCGTSTKSSDVGEAVQDVLQLKTAHRRKLSLVRRGKP